MSIGHEVGVIKLPDMAAGHGNPSVLTNQIQRYITELSAAGSMYDQFSSAITLDGDFRIGFKFLCGVQSTFVLYGQSSSFANHISVLPTKIEARIAGTRLSFTGSFQDGRLHAGYIERVGSVVTLEMDGVTIPEDTLLGSTSTLTLDVCGQENTTDFSDGIIYDYEITKAGTLIVDAKKDGDGSSNVIVNDAAVLGSEQVTDNTSGTWLNARAGAISDVSGGIRATANSTSTQGAAYPLTGLNVGEEYLVSFTTDSDDTTGSVFPRVAPDQDLSTSAQEIIPAYNVGDTTAVEGTFTATTSTMYVGVVRTTPGVGTYIEVTNATIKEIPAATPYLTRVNQTTDEVTQYTVEEGNYIGPEMWTYGDYTYTGDETEYALLLGNYGAEGGIEAGKAYRWSYTPDLSSSYATSQIRLRLGEGPVSTLTRDSTDGTTYSGIEVMAVDESRQDLLLQTGADPQFESGTVTGISVKRLIEVA